ncbi:MAG: CRISPR-associated protein [Erysipelotrichaceae bacterium]|nr:CRISPR-associated protein [Erysipelotrichaceae bacterium]
MSGLFLNFSNHPYSTWDENQLQAIQTQFDCAEKTEIAFPDIDPNLTNEQLKEMADKYIKEILAVHPDIVLCQGEFGLTHYIVNQLKAAGIVVVYACSSRVVENEVHQGLKKKIVIFSFTQFREYL